MIYTAESHSLFVCLTGFQEFLLLVWDDVCIYKDADIVLEQWFLLCKTLAYAKKNSNFCIKPAMQNLVSDMHIERTMDVGSALNLYLDKRVEKYDIPSVTAGNSLEQGLVDIDIVSWENIVGSSIELGSTYSLYNIRYSTSLPHFSLTEGGTRRRYSDFAFLVEVLGHRFRGVLVPPLPPKYDHLLDTRYHASQNKADHVAQSRANDLSIFLKNIARHPILSLSLEFMVFLQASTSGFASFRTTLKRATNMYLTVSFVVIFILAAAAAVRNIYCYFSPFIHSLTLLCFISLECKCVEHFSGRCGVDGSVNFHSSYWVCQ